MMRFLRPTYLLPLAVAATALIAPAAAHATLVGMESNSELVNTTQTNEQREAALDLMKQQGVQVVRANWRWYEVADGCGGQSAAALEDPDNACYAWSRLDNLVSAASARGMQVLLSIQQNPMWANGSSNHYYMGGTDAQFAQVKSYFASFYGAAAERYDGTHGHGMIRYWTVHNEPNSRFYWGGAPSPWRYAQLYGATAAKIKAANPNALIAAGPTGPTGGSGGMKPRIFIRAFQSNVVRFLPGTTIAAKRRYINAWAHNPYPNSKNQPSYSQRTQDPNSITMGTIDRLFTQLDTSALTRGIKVWATEFGWETRPERYQWTTTTRQAQFIAEAFDWLSSKQRGRVQIGINYGLTDPADLTDWQSGTITASGIKKPSFTMFKNMISVPQGGVAGRVRSGTRVRVWGRSNVHPGSTLLAYRIAGGRCRAGVAVSRYCVIPGQRSVIGTPGAKYGYVTVRRGQRIDFAVYDKTSRTYGPPRRIIGR